VKRQGVQVADRKAAPEGADTAAGPGEINRLMIACAAGDAAAFRKLHDRLAPQLFALAWRMLRDRQAAEDVVQETFLTVWKRLDRFDPSLGSAAGWMQVITRNKCLDRLRSKVRLVNEDDAGVPELPDLAPQPDSLAIASDEAERLRRCIEQLSEQQREAVLRAYFDGSTQEEIAARMNAPLGTVKSWVRRALLHLKECLDS
jgi:RNA polymerase sigma-70 factor, ECF subfamily